MASLTFAIGLSDQPDVLLGIIYNRLTRYLIIKPVYNNYNVFLQSVARELPKQFHIDANHNKYFNHATKDDPIVYIPSRFYKFDDDTPELKAVRYEVDESIVGACPHAECLIQVSGGALFVNVLLLLDKIQRHLKVFTSSFSLTELDFEHKTLIEMPLKSTIHLHENTKQFHITDSYLSQPAFARIVRELRVCQHLEDLHLFLLSQMLPRKLGTSLANKMSLKSVDIEACGLTDSTCQRVMLGLSTCSQLNSLNLSNVTLKDNLEFL